MTRSTARRRVGGNPRPARRRIAPIGLGRPQQGMVTVETAVAVAVLLVAGLLASAAPAVVGAQIGCADAAREAALLLARDQPASRAAAAVTTLAPQGARVSVRRGTSTIEVVVQARVTPLPGPLARALTLSVSGRSVALRESAALR
jgi:Flp pilus assembly protein TadG